MYKICAIQDFSKDIVLKASDLRTRYSLNFWDSIIIASAITGNCNILATEDLQDGLVIETTEIRNIFRTVA
jgi:predicted nucleic acid-binding protein